MLALTWRHPLVYTRSMADDAHPHLATTLAKPASQSREGFCLSLVVAGRGWIRNFELPQRGDVTIGRDPSCTIVLSDPAVSRKHASLSIGETITLSDLGSRGGVVVEGKPLAIGRRLELAIGQSFSLGTIAAMVQISPDLTVQANDSVLASLERTIARLARGTISVLITGETGVGKELVAETVHRLSPRAKRTLIKINCGAIAESLLESELFGHEKGAFTGAESSRAGLLEAADGGSIFLDEVGEMPLGVQVKLLRALESRQVRRVGGVVTQTYDARFIAATNRDLRAEVEAKRFREDLFYRLAGAVVWVPPLRSRRDEILPLAREFLVEASSSVDEPTPSLAPEAISWLLSYRWPGNVRELRNTMERACLLCEAGVVELRHLAEVVSIDVAASPAAAGSSPATNPADEKRARILEALSKTGGNQKLAAELLGISRRTLINWLEKYDIPRPRKLR